MFMEKLCHRIPAAENEDKLEMFLYCMKHIPLIGERAIKKLIQCFDLYKDKFVIENVRETFLHIITVARKQSKDNQPKSSIDELEAKIQAVCQKYENETTVHVSEKDSSFKENIVEEKPNFYASPIVNSRSKAEGSNLTPSTPNTRKKLKSRFVDV